MQPVCMGVSSTQHTVCTLNVVQSKEQQCAQQPLGLIKGLTQTLLLELKTHTHLTHFFLELLQIHLDLICQLVESQEALADITCRQGRD